MFLINCNGKMLVLSQIVLLKSDAKNNSTFDSLHSKFVTSMYCVSICNGGCVGHFDIRSYDRA